MLSGRILIQAVSLVELYLVTCKLVAWFWGFAYLVNSSARLRLLAKPLSSADHGFQQVELGLVFSFKKGPKTIVDTFAD